MAACQLFINRDTNNKIAALILVEGRAAIIFHSKTKRKTCHRNLIKVAPN